MRRSFIGAIQAVASNPVTGAPIFVRQSLTSNVAIGVIPLAPPRRPSRNCSFDGPSAETTPMPLTVTLFDIRPYVTIRPDVTPTLPRRGRRVRVRDGHGERGAEGLVRRNLRAWQAGRVGPEDAYCALH